MMRCLYLLVWVALVLMPGSEGHGFATPLLGDTAATELSAKAAGVNPANAAFINRTQLHVAPTIIESSELKVRYPGFATVTKDHRGPGDITTYGPAFVYKPTPRLGVGLVSLLPPGTVERRVNHVPIMVLGQPNFVDLSIVATSQGGVGGVIAYKIHRNLAVGLKSSIRGLSIAVDAVPSDGTTSLATIRIDQVDADVTAGALLTTTDRRISLGGALGLISYSRRTVEVESLLFDDARHDDGHVQSGGTAPINWVLLGVAAKASRFRLLVDLRYDRAPTGQTDFSFVDLQEKDKDLHDTVAVRAGIVAENVFRSIDVLAGGRYEPASVGSGRTGEGGKAGFGATEVVSIYAGQEVLKPYWLLASGVRFDFGDRIDRTRSKRSARRWTGSIGFAYQRGSLGVDEKGEQPGAYLQKRFFFPAEVIYRL